MTHKVTGYSRHMMFWEILSDMGKCSWYGQFQLTDQQIVPEKQKCTCHWLDSVDVSWHTNGEKHTTTRINEFQVLLAMNYKENKIGKCNRELTGWPLRLVRGGLTKEVTFELRQVHVDLRKNILSRRNSNVEALGQERTYNV